MATCPRICAWKTSWTEEPGRLRSWGHRVGHRWAQEELLEGSAEKLNFSRLEALKTASCYLVEHQMVDGWLEMTRGV